jgi:ubiquinone biosynthesis UbiH/UbiF/VisC/COQ6 family hydroxylase
MRTVKTDICIRGSGVVGQTLALLLARERIKVALTRPDRAMMRNPDLRSYALNAGSREILSALRAWPESATPVNQMRVWGDSGGHISFDNAGQPLAWIADAQDLIQRLENAVGFSPEIEMQSASDAQAAALTVICEGRMSETRSATGAAFENFAYGHTAIAARIQCEAPHENTAFQWMDASQVCALLPRGPSEPGNSVALVWSVADEQAQYLQMLNADDFAGELGKVTQGRLGALALASERLAWPLVLAQAKNWCGRWAQGSWVLAGDAAHAMHPLAGQGLNLGLGDAAELAKVLAAKPYFRSYADAKLLRDYERSRKAQAAALLLATDGLKQAFGRQDARLQAARNWGMSSLDALPALKSWLIRRASGSVQP